MMGQAIDSMSIEGGNEMKYFELIVPTQRKTPAYTVVIVSKHRKIVWKLLFEFWFIATVIRFFLFLLMIKT